MTTADTILDRKYEYCVQFLTMVPHSHLLSTIYSSLVWEFNQLICFFHRAALNGHFQVIRVLAAYGADLGKVALDGNTPLHYAAQQGFGPICKFLAQRGQLV